MVGSIPHWPELKLLNNQALSKISLTEQSEEAFAMKRDQQLIKLCRKGQRQAHNEIYQRYKNLVMSICTRYASSRNRAEDVFQEAFIRIFESFKKERALKVERLENWIARITINTSINHFYKQPKNETTEIPEILEDHHVDILESMSLEDVVDVINSLPDGYRTVFNMYVMDGYSHEDIAEQLKISASSSRSQLARAKSMLRKKLESLGIYRYEAS